jgi:hypothetical protein
VEIFVAQGHKGRITISCDDGKTWINDSSDDDNVRCFDPNAGNVDCDHDAGAGRGLAHGGGYWLATFGWGAPGRISRSKNGVDWEDFPQQAPHIFADLAFGDGVFVANGKTPRISSDGETWTDGGANMLAVPDARAIGFVDAGSKGKSFVVSGDTGGKQPVDMVFSKDGAKTWKHPTTRPMNCTGNVTGAVSGNGVIIFTAGGGNVCRSGDAGDTWTIMKVGTIFTSSPVWNGSEFMVWGNSTLYRSKDGVTWTNEPITPSSAHIGVAAVSSKGTFVAVNADWQAWYDKQEFYRSTDGVTWEVLPKTSFKGSHPIYFIEAGDAEASKLCPGK